MKDAQNNREILPQSEDFREAELSRENEISLSSEVIAEPEFVGDEEENKHAKQTTGEEESEDRKEDRDDEQGTDSSAASGGAGGAAGAAGAAGASVAVIAAVVIVVNAVIGTITAAFTKLDVFGTYFNFALTVNHGIYRNRGQRNRLLKMRTRVLILMVTKNGFSKAVPLVTGKEDLASQLRKNQYRIRRTPIMSPCIFSGAVDGIDGGTAISWL